MVNAILIIALLVANVSMAFLIYRRESYQKYLQKKAKTGDAVYINGEFYCIVPLSRFLEMEPEQNIET